VLDAKEQQVFGEPDAAGQALAERCGVIWTRAERAGRASQMNHGAASAEGDILLFLHADSHPPPDALAAIEKAIHSGAVGGAFTRRFDTPSRLLRFTCWLADWRGRALGIFLGDQGLCS
ncbi:MAG: glycosyltransferase, partial [Verrucomicrobia bacterium]|jgi:cellulose synthase/poly-beta-1,6-N-acetylglucosamine synthase-like glycosyltransferase|nr:glycosyltransferase [Verrucomicrobiota bacterium]